MAVYKLTLTWNQSVMGVSETYYTNDIAGSVVVDRINEFLIKRYALLWNVHETVGLRISVYGSRRASLFFPPGNRKFPGTDKVLIIPSQGALTGAGLQTRPDQLRAVIQMLWMFGDNKQTIRYLSGIPDTVSATEPGTDDLTGNPQWVANFYAWRQWILDHGWQIRARTVPPTDPEFPAANLVVQQAAPGLLGVVVATALTPNFIPGDKAHLRGFRPSKTSCSSINGIWFVDSVNTTLVPDHTVIWLRGSAGIDPNSQKTLGTIQRVKFTLFPVSYIGVYRVGIHKRGRPSPAPRGRRLVRRSLVP